MQATLLREIVPPGPCQLRDLADCGIELHPLERELRLALPVEFAHAGDGSRHILDSALDRDQITACTLAEVRLPLQERFRIERYRRNGVVDVVSDAARHLTQGPKPLLLHHGVLG